MLLLDQARPHFKPLQNDAEHNRLEEHAAQMRAVWSACMERHGSHMRALEACPDQHSDMVKANRAKNHHASMYLERIYREEYEAYCISTATAKPDLKPEACASATEAESHHTKEASDVTDSPGEIDGGDSDSDAIENYRLENSEESVTLALQQFGQLSFERTEMLAMSLGQMRDEGTNANIEEHLEGLVKTATSLQYRLHGVFREDTNGMVGYSGRQSTQIQAFSPKAVHLAEIYESISSDPRISGLEVTNTIIKIMDSELFGRSVLERWQSEISQCWYCDQSLDQCNPYAHLKYCREAQMDLLAQEMWEEQTKNLPSPCPIVNWIDKPTHRSICKKTYPTPNELRAHIRGHLVRISPFKCTWGNCNLRFDDDRKALAEHAWIFHGFAAGKNHECPYTLCRFCDEYVWEPINTNARIQHFEDHVDETIKQVHTYGYEGVTLAGRDGERTFYDKSSLLSVYSACMIRLWTLRAA